MIILKRKNQDGTYIQMAIDEDATWPEVCDNFVNFLQGCGYVVQGIDVAEHLMEQYEFQKKDRKKDK